MTVNVHLYILLPSKPVRNFKTFWSKIDHYWLFVDVIPEDTSLGKIAPFELWCVIVDPTIQPVDNIKRLKKTGRKHKSCNFSLYWGSGTSKAITMNFVPSRDLTDIINSVNYDLDRPRVSAGGSLKNALSYWKRTSPIQHWLALPRWHVMYMLSELIMMTVMIMSAAQILAPKWLRRP